MRGFVKVGSYYTGVDPNRTSIVYYNRPGEPNAGGPWEEVEFTPQGNAYAVRYTQANKQLSIQNDGRLETRPAGTYGPFELFQIRTEEGSGRHILYRDDVRGAVLEVEVIS